MEAKKYKKNFYIYKDAGTNNTCVQEWDMRLQDMGISVQTICSDEIKRNGLKHARAFIMPGGADVPYCQKLEGAGNAAIAAFVHNGGLYIGSCAGAYYAHQNINWLNGEERITGTRELAFFDGTATGPIVKPYNALTNQGLAFVSLHYRGKNALVYYKGGPLMPAQKYTQCLASFTISGVQYPAVVKTSVHKGIAIAISPHIEYTDAFLSSINAPPCAQRSTMFCEIMTELLTS